MPELGGERSSCSPRPLAKSPCCNPKDGSGRMVRSCELWPGLTLILMGRLPRCALDLNCVLPSLSLKGAPRTTSPESAEKSLLEKLPRNHSLGSLLVFPRSEEGTSEISGTLSRDWVHITETGTTRVTSTVGTSPRGGYLSDPSSETRQQWKIPKTLLHSFTRRLLNAG